MSKKLDFTFVSDAAIIAKIRRKDKSRKPSSHAVLHELFYKCL
jgi:hypothetical protein